MVRSGRAIYPWRLADWPEEVRLISSQLNCKFVHVLSGASEAADALAKEGSTH